jgi:predicted transcriptional regulator
MERVADVLGLKYPQFNTISPSHLVSDALYQMCAENADHLIVLQHERFCGIITGADIANKVLFVDRPLNEIVVKEFMNCSLPVVTLNDSVEHGLQLLKQYGTKYLAVYDRFDFKGVVSSFDLMQHALNHRSPLEDEVFKEQSFTWSY